MGDIYCAVCGEPWDRESVYYDMEPKERENFLAGRGCPTCKGKGDRKSTFKFLVSLSEATDEDPVELLMNVDFGGWDDE